jgi:hypothetical protein
MNNVDMTATKTMQQTARDVWRLMNAMAIPESVTTSIRTFGRAHMTGK